VARSGGVLLENPPQDRLCGLSIAFHPTGGEVSDTTQLEILFDIGQDITPRAAITDKGYDSAANRAACRHRGIFSVIQ
jgi:Transposase DDE domain